MNPRHLEFVIAVADHLNFTRAAETVHVSQPSLSHAIASIEEQLGTPLFYRLGRKVALTPAGDVFVESARRVLRDLAVLLASVDSVAELTAGHLDVAAVPALASERVSQLVGEFRTRYPGVQVRIQTPENPHEIERFVRTGQCELALAMGSVEPPLIAEEIGWQEHLVVFPPGTKLKRRPVARAELAGLPLVVPTGALRHYGLALDLPADSPPPIIAVEIESRQALIPLVQARAGITFLPRGLAENAEKLGLVIAELDPPLRRKISLVTRPGPLSPAAKVFAELARGAAA